MLASSWARHGDPGRGHGHLGADAQPAGRLPAPPAGGLTAPPMRLRPPSLPGRVRHGPLRCAGPVWRPLMRAASASTRHVEQADHGAFGLVPDRNHFGRRQQLNLAPVAFEIGGRLLRQHHRVVLARAEEEPRRPLLVDVLGLGQRLFALLDLTAEPDDHVVGEDRSLDGDRAELRPVDPGLHGASPPSPPMAGQTRCPRTDPQNRPREAAHGTRAAELPRWSSRTLVRPGRPDSAKPTYTLQRQAIAPEAGDRCHSEPAQGGLADEVGGEVVQLVALEAAGVADVGEDRDAVAEGNADSDVALRVLGDAGHPGVYAVLQRVGALL